MYFSDESMKKYLSFLFSSILETWDKIQVENSHGETMFTRGFRTEFVEKFGLCQDKYLEAAPHYEILMSNLFCKEALCSYSQEKSE